MEYFKDSDFFFKKARLVILFSSLGIKCQSNRLAANLREQLQPPFDPFLPRNVAPIFDDVVDDADDDDVVDDTTTKSRLNLNWRRCRRPEF